ncbi:MAG: hypothetical protein D6689_15945 [Deltaproteobacteria bacterium]|nr:MAG: hypothetical protein D6689_15945 [Deltaproteobacteria bacterium]
MACALLWACGQSEDPTQYAKKLRKETAPPRPPPKIVKVQTPVAPGAKVKCEDWVDLAKFKEALGEQEDLGLKDLSRTEVDPTSVCSIVKGGEPPSAEQQAKTFEKNAYKIGVVGGDELCLVHVFCGYVATAEDLQRKCKADAMSDLKEIDGRPACVHRTQRASEWAYKYSVIDDDTTCGLDVQGGPSVTDEGLVQKCTAAALDSLTKDGIANPYRP